MSRTVRVLLATLVAVVALLAPVVASTASAAPACSTPWTSLPDTAAPMNPSPVVAVRTGRHACFDRVVVQIAGSVGAGWDVRYVPVVTQDGSGDPLDVPGGAKLSFSVHHPAYDEAGEPTFFPTHTRQVANVAGYRTLRSAIFGGSFEGYTLFGVGTRARLPFRVYALPGPGGDTRIVLDIAHRWS